MAVEQSSGATPYRNEALVATPDLVRDTSGQVYGYHIYNPSNAAAFVHFYDAATAASVTVGTGSATTPKFTLFVPQSGATDMAVSKVGIGGFALGIVVAATTSHLKAGSTAPSTGLLIDAYHN